MKTIQKVWFVLRVMILVHMLVGCGTQESSSSSRLSSSSASTNLVGSYKSACIQVTDDGLYSKFSMTFTGSQVTSYLELYWEDTCLIGDRLFYQTEINDYVVNGSKITYKLVSLSFMVTDYDMIDEFNKNNTYGYSNWKTFEYKNIAGRAWQTNSEKEDEVGSSRDSVYKVEGQSYYFGEMLYPFTKL